MPDCRASLREAESTMVLKLMPSRYGRRRPAPSLRQYFSFFVNWDSTPTCHDLNLKGPVPIGLPVYVFTRAGARHIGNLLLGQGNGERGKRNDQVVLHREGVTSVTEVIMG